MQYQNHPNNPANQPFSGKAKASACSNERKDNGIMGKNLRIRQADYKRMIGQNKIGDGHRDANGYTKPGSNKK